MPRLSPSGPATALFLLAALWLPACGEPAARSDAPPVDSTDTRAYSLLQLVEREGRLSAVARALHATNLAETLQQDDGPYTLFAPTDSALRRSFLTLDTLLQRRPDSLRAFLRLHLVRGRLRPVDVPDGPLQVSTLARTPLTLRPAGDGLLQVDGHAARRAVAARNGVLYVLPAVLRPPPSDTLR